MVQVNRRRILFDASLLFVLVVAVALLFRVEGGEAVGAATQVAGSFFAALLGALAAFNLQSRRDDQAQSQREVAAANLLTLSLIVRFDMIRVVKIQVIDPVRDTQGRPFLMSPINGPWPTDRLNINELVGLLGDDVAPHLIGIVMAERKFELAKMCIELHGKLHMDFQEAIGLSNLPKVGAPLDTQVRGVIGERLWHSIHAAADQMIQSSDDAYEALKESLESFPVAFKRRHPNARVLAFRDVGPTATGTGWI